MLYLCEGDGADRRFRILSPRCFPACLSPQQRDTRSLSAFQKRIYGNWAKKLRTYVPTNLPLAESSTNGSVGDFAYRRLSRSALGRTPPPSAVFKIIVMGIKKKIRTHFRFGKSGSDYTGLVRETGLDSRGSSPLGQRRSQAPLGLDSLRLLQVRFLL